MITLFYYSRTQTHTARMLVVVYTIFYISHDGILINNRKKVEGGVIDEKSLPSL